MGYLIHSVWKIHRKEEEKDEEPQLAKCKSEFMGLCIGLAITSVEQYLQLRSHVKALYNNSIRDGHTLQSNHDCHFNQLRSKDLVVHVATLPSTHLRCILLYTAAAMLIPRNI